jgi:hypothetical protein
LKRPFKEGFGQMNVKSKKVAVTETEQQSQIQCFAKAAAHLSHVPVAKKSTSGKESHHEIVQLSVVQPVRSRGD